jgi:hypothetical protein
MEQKYQVNDKVWHNPRMILGTVTEIALRGAGTYVYRVSWKGSPANDFTWHPAEELLPDEVIQAIWTAFQPENINQEAYAKFWEAIDKGEDDGHSRD